MAKKLISFETKAQKASRLKRNRDDQKKFELIFIYVCSSNACCRITFKQKVFQTSQNASPIFWFVLNNV